METEARSTQRSNVRGWGVAGLGLAAIVLGALAAWRAYDATGPVRITVSPAYSENVRHPLMLMLAREAADRGIELEVVESADSIDAIERIEAGTLDFALILGGFDFTQYSDLRLVSALQVAPLHLLVKEEIYPEVARNLHALRGRTVNLGSGPKTLTYSLAREILAFASLQPRSGAGPNPPGDYLATTLSLTQLTAEQDRARLPDAIFVTETLPAPAALLLVREQRYRLVELPFRDAFALRALAPREHRSAGAVDAAGVLVQKEHVYDTVIPAFTYQIDPGVPPQATHTLGVKELLITRQKTDSRLVLRLLETIYTTRFARVIQPLVGSRPDDQPMEIPWHHGASWFFRQNEPIVTEKLLDNAGQVMTIAAPIAGALACFAQWLRHRSRFRREQSFESYISRVTAVECKAMELDHARFHEPELLAEVIDLHRQLSQLKSEALSRFARGELEGGELITSFLTHVNDTRAHLASLIRLLRDSGVRISVEPTVDHRSP